MYGMTTACLYRSHRLYDHSCHVRNPYGSTVPCIPPAQVHSHSRVNPSNYHIHTRPHTHTTPRRTTPPRIVAETPKPGRIVEMSPGLLACNTLACEEAMGTSRRCDRFSGFRRLFAVGWASSVWCGCVDACEYESLRG